MKVLSIAYPFAPVREDAAGGAEHVLSMLDRHLVEHGHHSIVIACEGSRIAGDLIKVPQIQGIFTEEAKRVVYQEVERAIRLARDLDVIHLHGIDFPEYMPQSDAPVIATLHLPLNWYAPGVFKTAHCVCVSYTQRQGLPGAEVIENGIPLEPYLAAQYRKRNYVLALGRICPEKGFLEACDAAGLANAPLIIAGQVYGYESHIRYSGEVMKRVNGCSVRFVGAVMGRAKRRLIGSARAVLLPYMANETSSLVAMEAMACGTPVVAFASGALPEVVAHGRTGFIVHNVEEMAAAIERVDEISAQECRREAQLRFDARRMGEQYVGLYMRLAGLNRKTGMAETV